MPNTSPSAALHNIELAAGALDAQVTDSVMGSLELAHDPKEWGSQVEEYLPARYRMKAEAAEKAIRAVAQKFVGTDRADDLFKRRSDLFDRCGILDEIVDALDIFASPEFILEELGPQDPAHLRYHLPLFNNTMRIVIRKLSRWQQDLRKWQAVFLVLQSAAITDLLLHSIPATVPAAHVAQGRDLVDRLVGFWSERKDVVEAARLMYAQGILEDPEPLLERLDVQRERLPQVVNSFTDLLQRLDELPPLCVLRREYSARQLWDADLAFTRLSSELDSINQDVNYLEYIFDRIMSVFDDESLPMVD